MTNSEGQVTPLLVCFPANPQKTAPSPRRRAKQIVLGALWEHFDPLRLAGDQSVPNQQALGGQSTKGLLSAGPNRDNHLVYSITVWMRSMVSASVGADCLLMTQSEHSKRRLNRYDERGFLRIGTNFAHLATRRFFFCASSGGARRGDLSLTNSPIGAFGWGYLGS